MFDVAVLMHSNILQEHFSFHFPQFCYVGNGIILEIPICGAVWIPNRIISSDEPVWSEVLMAYAGFCELAMSYHCLVAPAAALAAREHWDMGLLRVVSGSILPWDLCHLCFCS